MTCSFCGEYNEHGSETCTMCGERLQKAVDGPLPSTPPPSTSASSSSAPPMPSQISPYQSAHSDPPSVAPAPPSYPPPVPPAPPPPPPPMYPPSIQPAPPPMYPPPYQPVSPPPPMYPPPSQPPMGQLFYVPTYVPSPGPPGRGLGIASLVLGIIGLLCSFSVFITILSISSYYRYYGLFREILIASLFYSPLTILACIFSGAAMSKGYKTGVSKAGLVLSVVSFGLIIFTFLLPSL